MKNQVATFYRFVDQLGVRNFALKNCTPGLGEIGVVLATKNANL